MNVHRERAIGTIRHGNHRRERRDLPGGRLARGLSDQVQNTISQAVRAMSTVSRVGGMVDRTLPSLS
jgi:hypothetical protein